MEENLGFIQSSCRITNDQVLLNEQPIYQNIDQLETVEWIKDLYKKIQLRYPKFHKMDLLAKGTLLACELINRQLNFAIDQTALVFSNRGASSYSDRKHAEAIHTDPTSASPAVFVYTLPNIALGEVCIRFGLHGENNFFIFDKFAADFMVEYQNTLLTEPEVDKILGGWIEVDHNELDIFVYLIGRSGNNPHTAANLLQIY